MLSLLNIDYSSMISTLPLDSGSSDSLSNFINNGLVGLVTEADTTYKIAGSVIALILALIGCFFGYKLSRLFMGITGFIAGAIIGQIVASQILHVEGFASVLCIILCGAVIASLAFWIYRIGIFILCFALAFSAAGTLFPFEGDVQFFANVITGLIVGVLAVKYMHYTYFRNRMWNFRCRATSGSYEIYGNYDTFFTELQCSADTGIVCARDCRTVSYYERTGEENCSQT